MVKWFCDVCQGPMGADETGRIKRRLGDVEIEVMHSFKNTWNAGHVCHACLSNVLRNGQPLVPNQGEGS